MGTTFSSSLKLAVAWLFKNELDLGDVADSNRLQIEDALADGSGLDQAEVVWHDRRTLAAATAETLDLAGGLTDGFGQTLTLTGVKLLLVKNRTATAGVVLEIGGGDDGAGNNAFDSWLADASDKVKVGPDGAALVYGPSAAAYSVTAGTGDILRIKNSSGSDSAEYDIVIIGTVS